MFPTPSVPVEELPADSAEEFLSGAGISVLPESKIKQLGAPPWGEVRIRMVSGEVVRRPTYWVVMNLAGRNVMCKVASMPPERVLDGPSEVVEFME